MRPTKTSRFQALERHGARGQEAVVHLTMTTFVGASVWPICTPLDKYRYQYRHCWQRTLVVTVAVHGGKFSRRAPHASVKVQQPAPPIMLIRIHCNRKKRMALCNCTLAVEQVS